METELRSARGEDLFFLTESLQKTFLELAKSGETPYERGFMQLSVEAIEAYALEYLDPIKARSFILQYNGRDIGCMMGKIAPSHLSAADLGLVGWIGLCYIEEAFRKEAHCTRLFEAIQTWFASMSVEIIELSYLATNASAKRTWERLGFSPLRVIAYKTIDLSKA